MQGEPHGWDSSAHPDQAEHHADAVAVHPATLPVPRG